MPCGAERARADRVGDQQLLLLWSQGAEGGCCPRSALEEGRVVVLLVRQLGLCPLRDDFGMADEGLGINVPGDLGLRGEVHDGVGFDADARNPQLLAFDGRRAGATKRVEHQALSREREALDVVPDEMGWIGQDEPVPVVNRQVLEMRLVAVTQLWRGCRLSHRVKVPCCTPDALRAVDRVAPPGEVLDEFLEFLPISDHGLELTTANSICLLQVENWLPGELGSRHEAREVLEVGDTLLVVFDGELGRGVTLLEDVAMEVVRNPASPLSRAGGHPVHSCQVLLHDIADGLELVHGEVLLGSVTEMILADGAPVTTPLAKGRADIREPLQAEEIGR